MQKILTSERTQSPLERVFLDNIREYGLEPVTQYPIGVFFVDFAFPDDKLVVEIDGDQWHSSRHQIEKDVYRQKSIERRGWTVIRYPGWHIHRYPRLAAAEVALRYMDKHLNDKTRKRAMGAIATYLAINGDKSAVKLANYALED